MSMVSFIFTMRRHLIRLASAPFTSFRLAKFGWVPFAELRVQRLATNKTQNLWRVGKNSVPKVHEIFRWRRRPVICTRLSMSSFVQNMFAIKSRSRRKTEQIYTVFVSHFFRKRRPQLFNGRLLARFTVHHLVKFSWVSFVDVCEDWKWSSLECRNGQKLQSNFKPFMDQNKEIHYIHPKHKRETEKNCIS